MPRCAHCGATSPESSRFCVSCGKVLAVEQASARRVAPSSADLARADRLLTEAFGLSDEGRLTDAVRVAQQVVVITPDSTTAHSLLGTLHERLGNRDAAIKEYQTVLSLSPGSTADRQRLNELLGLPATAEAPRVVLPRAATRRPDLVYVIGGSVILVLAIIATILLIGGPAPEENAVSASPPPAARTAAAPFAQPAPPNTVAQLPVPGLPQSAPSAAMPAAPLPQFPPVTADAGAAPQQSPRLVPLSAESREPARMVLPYPGYRPAGQEPAPRFLAGGGYILETAPKVKTPTSFGRTGILRSTVQPSVATAHRLVTSGRLAEASEIYEAALARRPNAEPQARQELAAIYSRLNEHAKAAEHYTRALGIYQSQLDSGAAGDTAVAAEHGIATCRAALRALGIDIP